MGEYYEEYEDGELEQDTQLEQQQGTTQMTGFGNLPPPPQQLDLGGLPPPPQQLNEFGADTFQPYPYAGMPPQYDEFQPQYNQYPPQYGQFQPQYNEFQQMPGLAMQQNEFDY